jgi:type II secretory pathway component PulF
MLAAVWRLSNNLLSRWARLRKQEVFFRQFHALVKAGVPLPTAFVQLKSYAPDEAFATGLSVAAKQIAHGSSLAEALRAQPDTLTADQVELIAAAEQSGSLERVLHALAQHLEELRRLRWKAFTASIWPAYLVGVLVFLGPFVRVGSSGVRSTGDVMGAYVAGLVPGLVGLIGAALGVVLWPVLVEGLGAQAAWDRFVLSLPGLGGALRSLAASNALLTLGLSLSAGLEVARALRVSLLASGRPTFAGQAEAAVARVRAGGSMGEALGGLGLFDRATLGQLAIAEHTGTLDETLRRLGPELHESTIRAMRVLVLVVAGLVATVALAALVSTLLGAIFGPIKAYYDAIGNGGL